MSLVTRRTFVTAVAATALVPASELFAEQDARSPTAPAGYLFFEAADARFVAAACARLMPPEPSAPGAPADGLPRYLDAQLAGAWGSGQAAYRTGHWQPGTPSPASAACATPARSFRSVLRAIDDAFERRGHSFCSLSNEAQDAFLVSLQSGTAEIGVPTAAFFALLLQMTVEGFFSDPHRAATRERIPWSMTAFPGAHAERVAR